MKRNFHIDRAEEIPERAGLQHLLRGRQPVNIYKISIFKLDPVTDMLDRLCARKFTPECLTVAFRQPPCWLECLSVVSGRILMF